MHTPMQQHVSSRSPLLTLILHLYASATGAANQAAHTCQKWTVDRGTRPLFPNPKLQALYWLFHKATSGKHELSTTSWAIPGAKQHMTGFWGKNTCHQSLFLSLSHIPSPSVRTCGVGHFLLPDSVFSTERLHFLVASLLCAQRKS